MILYIYLSPGNLRRVHRNLMYSMDRTIHYRELHDIWTEIRTEVADTPGNRLYMIQLAKR